MRWRCCWRNHVCAMVVRNMMAITDVPSRF
jgi:hypothetical protein